MVTDPIADMLARIRNAAVAHHDVAKIPASKLKQAIGEILKREGYIADVRLEEGESVTDARIVVALKYDKDRSSAFRGMRRVSRPGRRVYARHDHLPRVLSGLGISIISTSQGLMTDQEARRNKVGGEVLCEVW
ncbi:MAG TPA: 30S ribosomal protein S8 [Polyangiaceae bacterium]|jgi:small subunit ribosomal protein S8|nr:30S ribosomal protein S8 [Polyangiaceae bacterium]